MAEPIFTPEVLEQLQLKYYQPMLDNDADLRAYTEYLLSGRWKLPVSFHYEEL
jgi:hypothetical protein